MRLVFHVLGRLLLRLRAVAVVALDPPQASCFGACLIVAPAAEEAEEDVPLPKMKTHKGAARRFKVSGSGKLLRMHRGKSHLRRKKAKRVKGLFDDTVAVARSDYKRLRRVLPYAGFH